MHRYIAFVWNAENADQSALAKVLGQRIESKSPSWAQAFHSDSLDVYCSEATACASRIYRLARNGGLVIGELFASSTACTARRASFEDRESERVQQSEGRYLIERYWGRYVAMFKPEHGSGIRILRDPTGALPCFITKFQGVDIICSHIEDCAALGLITCGINWDHLAAYLWFDHMVTPHTGLDCVYQVQAGQCVTLGAGRSEATYYWNPSEIYRRRTVENRGQAMQELRSVIQHCVSAWASCYDNILHELSGGLDSAIVLAALSRARNSPKILCENHFTRDIGGDERLFARQAAKLAEVEFIETPIASSGRSLEVMFDSTKVATPTMTAFIPETQSRREHIVKLHGIEAVFSGQGGDHFFQSIKTREIAAEYAWRNGLRKEILPVISDTSRFTRQSIWSVMRTVITSGLLHRSTDPYGKLKPSPLLSDEARRAIHPTYSRHSWVDLAVDLPACKRRQIFDIIDTQNFYRLPNHYADIIHPLISQPIIELCLQIPSYVLTYGGIDRALVRDAFRGSIPGDIARRTVKGATTGYFSGLLVQNARFLREFLLHGLLVKEGLVDKRRTNSVLSESSLIRGADLLFPIMDAVRAEFWLRTWNTADRRAAA